MALKNSKTWAFVDSHKPSFSQHLRYNVYKHDSLNFNDKVLLQIIKDEFAMSK